MLRQKDCIDSDSRIPQNERSQKQTQIFHGNFFLLYSYIHILYPCYR